MIDGPGAQYGNNPEQKAKWNWGVKPPQLYTLCALAFLSTPVGLLVPDRLSALLLVIGGLTLLTNPVSGMGPIKRQRYLYPLLGLLAFAGISILWSNGETKPAIDGFLKLAGFAVFGILLVTYALELREGDKRLLGRWLVPSLWAFCALFLFDRVSDGSLTGLLAQENGTGVAGGMLLLLSWPAAGMLFRSDRPYQAIALVMAAGLVQAGHQAQGIMLAWLAGGVFAGFAALLPRVTAGLLAALSVCAALALPFLAGQPGAVQRLIPGAKPVSEAIRDHLLFGRGLVPESLDPKSMEPVGSAVLRVWLDLGIVGALILCALVGILAAAGCKGPPAARAARIGLLAAAFVLACVSHDAWRGPWVAALFITGAFAAALPDRVGNR